MYNVLPWGYATSGVASAVCGLFNGTFCNLLMGIFTNDDPTIDYTPRYDVYMSNLPSGAGYRNIIHYGQLVNQKSEAFVRYDWGKRTNIEKYGVKSPPSYDLGAIDFPLALFGGEKDLLADPKDVDWTASQLKESTNIFYH